MSEIKAIRDQIHGPKHGAKKGDIYQGPDGAGIVEYVNRFGDVTMKITGRQVPVYCAEFIDSYWRVEL